MEQEENVTPISEVEFEARHAKELEKAKEKEEKAEIRFDNQIKKLEYQRKIRQMDMETNLKIKQRQDFMKQNYKKSVDGSTSGAIYDGK